MSAVSPGAESYYSGSQIIPGSHLPLLPGHPGQHHPHHINHSQEFLNPVHLIPVQRYAFRENRVRQKTY